MPVISSLFASATSMMGGGGYSPLFGEGTAPGITVKCFCVCVIEPFLKKKKNGFISPIKKGQDSLLFFKTAEPPPPPKKKRKRKKKKIKSLKKYYPYISHNCEIGTLSSCMSPHTYTHLYKEPLPLPLALSGVGGILLLVCEYILYVIYNIF